MSNDHLHPLFAAIADALCPPSGDDLAKRMTAFEEAVMEEEAMKANPTADDRISRLDLVRWLEDEQATIRRRMRPESGWAEQDLARLYLLSRVIDHVNAAKSCEEEMWGAK